ncbi:hypothetical protein [Bradyrhizobium sp. WSM2254]|uniref:hypothetical protein n=1 Tax=Bradyrhizobium sp. WSM2254 TaxID=1188263 RepID=UPI0012EB3A14|nr:hypothetical protein [Bradyrhizobium sp. WSM2254]
MDPVSQLRASLLPILQDLQQELGRKHPDVTTNIFDWPVGELTSWQGHDLGIECTFSDVAPEQPDHVVLSVSLKHLHEAPSIHSADVVWADGTVEASVLPESVEFSPDCLAGLIERIPELSDALRQTIRRGRPVA